MSEFDQLPDSMQFRMASAESCAVLQIHGLPDLASNKTTPARAMIELLTRNGVAQWYGDEFDFNEDIEPFWLLTQGLYRTGEGWVDKFVKWLEREELGNVVIASARLNKNSYNKAKVYVYTPNVRALKRWAKRNMQRDDYDTY